MVESLLFAQLLLRASMLVVVRCEFFEVRSACEKDNRTQQCQSEKKSHFPKFVRHIKQEKLPAVVTSFYACRRLLVRHSSIVIRLSFRFVCDWVGRKVFLTVFSNLLSIFRARFLLHTPPMEGGRSRISPFLFFPSRQFFAL